MVATYLHNVRINDTEFQINKIGKDNWEKRSPHLKILSAVETLVVKHTPLPISYDVARMQPPYFNEFAYTELMGCLWVQPQSTEITARLILKAIEDDSIHDFDVFSNIKQRDKYTLEKPLTLVNNKPINFIPKKVVFLPGHNIFEECVSAELLMRLMYEDEEVLIKQHPITHESMTRKLGQLFGYSRVIDRDASGSNLLNDCDTVYVTSSTEVGLLAMAQSKGKKVVNLTRYHFEPRGSYSPIYYPLWNKTPEQQTKLLAKIVNSPLSGFFHPDDPDLEGKIETYFAAAMHMRSKFKPTIVEHTPDRWGDLVLGFNRSPEPLRVRTVDAQQKPKT